MTAPNEKTAIVIGASRGIGAAVAQRLASDGFAVVVNFAGAPEDAEGQLGQIVKAGGRTIAAVAFAIIDRVRSEMLHRVGFSDLLKPHAARKT